MKRILWPRLALAMVSIVLSVYLVESVLCIVRFRESNLDANAEKVRRAKRAGKSYDTRTRLEFYKATKRDGEDIVPAVYPAWFLDHPLALDGREVVPLSGIANAKTFLCNESGQYVAYVSDEYGFQNPPGVYGEPAEIVVLGDSYAHGFWVDQGANAAAVIRERHPKTVNLGFGGNGPLLEYATLLEYGAAFKPRVVVWLFFEGNDLHDLDKEFKNKILTSYLSGEFSQQLAARKMSLDAEVRAVVEQALGTESEGRRTEDRRKRSWQDYAGDVVFLRDFRRQVGAFRQPAADLGNLDRLLAILSKSDDAARSWGGSLLFVYIPEWKSLKWSTVDYYGRERIVDAVRDLGLEVLDLQPLIKRLDDPLSLWPYRMRGHFNEVGYRFMAESLLPAVRRKLSAP